MKPSWMRVPSARCVLAVTLVCLAGVPIAVACADSPAEPGPRIPPPSADWVETTVFLTDEDFEDTPLGGEPYPFIAETWCPEAFVGASDEAARSGLQSLRYHHGCGPGVNATITAVSFAMCTRWPTAARVVFFRRHDDFVNSDFALFSWKGEEPRTALLFGADGGIRASDGVDPDIVVGQYQLGEWTKVETAWDFLGGTYELGIDDVHIGSFPTYVTKAFWLLFGSFQQGSTFYDDDVAVTLDLRGERQNCDGTEPLPWPWPPEEGQQGG